jgi:multidrug efflux pump subunit AcrB
LGGVQTLWRANSPQLRVDVDREKAHAMGVNLNNVYDTLAATLGSYYVNDFNKYGRTWQVLMSAEPEYRAKPDDIGNSLGTLRQRRNDSLIVLSHRKYSAGPDTLDRFNNLPAVKLFGQGAMGVSSGQAIAEVEKVANQVLPVILVMTGVVLLTKKNKSVARQALL